MQTYQNTNTQAARTLFTLLKKQNWTRIGLIYEEGDTFWSDFATTISKKDSLQVVAKEHVPKPTKFSKYGETFLEFPPMVQRNRTLARVREVLTSLAERRIKSR